MSVLLLSHNDGDLSDEMIDQIKRAMPPTLELLHSRDPQVVNPRLAEIEICAGWFDYKLLPQMTSLRWLQQWGAGANWLLKQPEALDMPFTLTNMSGVHAIQISEHIMATLLSFARNLRHAQVAQQARVWARMRPERVGITDPYSRGGIFELAGLTMILIGVGAIGVRTAKLASAFDMHVIGVRRNPERSVAHVAEMVGPDALLDVLPRADVVVITAPLTAETRHMIGAEQLAAMKSTAHIINIGRGGTIDEDALYQALSTEQIAGAALDVFETEPLPSESPFWDLDNILITAHYSGGSNRYHERAVAIFVDNLERYRDGQPLRNVVDKQLGY